MESGGSFPERPWDFSLFACTGGSLGRGDPALPLAKRTGARGVCRGGGGTRLCARTHGVAAEHGPDAGRDRRRVAGFRLALFRPVPIPDLPVPAAAQAFGATAGRPRAGRRAHPMMAPAARWHSLRIRPITRAGKAFCEPPSEFAG